MRPLLIYSLHNLFYPVVLKPKLVCDDSLVYIPPSKLASMFCENWNNLQTMRIISSWQYFREYTTFVQNQFFHIRTFLYYNCAGYFICLISEFLNACTTVLVSVLFFPKQLLLTFYYYPLEEYQKLKPNMRWLKLSIHTKPIY